MNFIARSLRPPTEAPTEAEPPSNPRVAPAIPRASSAPKVRYKGVAGTRAGTVAVAVGVADAVAPVPPTNDAVTTSDPYVGPTTWYLNEAPSPLPLNATVNVAPPFASSSIWQCLA